MGRALIDDLPELVNVHSAYRGCLWTNVKVLATGGLETGLNSPRKSGCPQGCPATPCVCPSWAGTKGGSSPPCDETMKEESTTRSQLRKGDRPWESRRWESHQAMNKNLLRGRRGRVMEDLQRHLRGAVNYYAPGIPYREIVGLDQWLRRRVRLYHWKQWGRPRTRRRKLLALGIDRAEVHMASRSRKGHWRMSRNSIVHRAMTDAWLHGQGVPDLVRQWVAIRYPDGPKGSRGMA